MEPPEPPKLPIILVVSYDEDKKRFLIYQGNNMFRGPKIQSNVQNSYLTRISEVIQTLKPDLVVCCTQNSLSCTKDHFQHYFKDLMINLLRKKEKSMKYSLISKADATTENDSSFWSCSTKISNNSKPYNVRTRVYRYEDTLEANLSEKNISKELNKKSKYEELYLNRVGTIPIDKLYVEYIGFRRITETSNGIGGILYDIMICRKLNDTTDPTCYQNIFCNYNLDNTSSTRILNGMATNKNLQKNSDGKLKNELKIFMITSDTIKAKKFSKGEIGEILINNNTKLLSGENINVTRRKRIIGKNMGNIKFKKINIEKINNNVIIKQFQPKNKNKRILKDLIIFNT